MAENFENILNNTLKCTKCLKKLRIRLFYLIRIENYLKKINDYEENGGILALLVQWILPH